MVPHALLNGGEDTEMVLCQILDKLWIKFHFYRIFTIQVYRISEEDRDRRVDRDDEFSDSEDEGEGGRRNKEDFKHASS